MAGRVYNGWIYEQDASGEWVRSRPAGGPAPNPTYDLEAPKMQGEIANTTLDNQTKEKNLRQNPLSDRDAALINTMRLGLGDMPAVLRDITAAQRAVDRFEPAPGRGTLYGAGTPTDEDGLVVSGLKRVLGGVLPDQSQEDYQTLSGLQNASVLNAQIAQKGPQTESDAVRMKLTSVSPNKDVRPNAQLLAEQQYDAQMKMERPSFYTYWANQLGSTQALNSKKQAADQVWTQQYQRGLQQMRNDSRYQGRKLQNAPRKQNRVIDWKDY